MFEAAAFIIGLLIGFILCAVMYTAKHINDIEVPIKQYMDMTNLLYHTCIGGTVLKKNQKCTFVVHGVQEKLRRGKKLVNAEIN